MQVLKEETLQQLPTPVLKTIYQEEWDRISAILVHYTPLSDGTSDWLVKELRLLQEELERREQNRPTY